MPVKILDSQAVSEWQFYGWGRGAVSVKTALDREERIGLDDKPADSQPGEACKRHLDLAFGGRVQNLELQAERASRHRHIARVRRRIWIGP